jgi:hypothetical protein
MNAISPRRARGLMPRFQSSVSRTAHSFTLPIPPINRWAIFTRPLRGRNQADFFVLSFHGFICAHIRFVPMLICSLNQKPKNGRDRCGMSFEA